MSFDELQRQISELQRKVDALEKTVTNIDLSTKDQTRRRINHNNHVCHEIATLKTHVHCLMNNMENVKRDVKKISDNSAIEPPGQT